MNKLLLIATDLDQDEETRDKLEIAFEKLNYRVDEIVESVESV